MKSLKKIPGNKFPGLKILFFQKRFCRGKAVWKSMLLNDGKNRMRLDTKNQIAVLNLQYRPFRRNLQAKTAIYKNKKAAPKITLRRVSNPRYHSNCGAALFCPPPSDSPFYGDKPYALTQPHESAYCEFQHPNSEVMSDIRCYRLTPTDGSLKALQITNVSSSLFL